MIKTRMFSEWVKHFKGDPYGCKGCEAYRRDPETNEWISVRSMEPERYANQMLAKEGGLRIRILGNDHDGYYAVERTE